MTAASSEGVRLLVERAGGVALLRLNRPAKRNAIDRELARELGRTVAELSRDDGVRVLVLTGNGDAFCAGNDLSDRRPPDAASELRSGSRLTAPIDSCPKPVLAAVNGAAYGGGCELALAADLRVASPRASFCLPEVRIGSMPGSGGTQRLVRAVGSTVAARMLYTGEPIGGEEALRVGLVSELFDEASLVEDAVALASRIARNAPLSLLALKRALGTWETPAGLALERSLWAALATTEDRAEGRAAFRERREPTFRGE